MSLRFFEGPAGCGKTTRLMAEVRIALDACPLAEHQRVLALTRMHGSRRRLQQRLAVVPGLRHQFECVTVDGFAWRLLCRWRALARVRFGPTPSALDYTETCIRAGSLLADRVVARWVTQAYPIVVVDELQDSKGGQLAVVQGLSAYAICLAAADDFQDLDEDGANPAVSWARDHGDVSPLTQNHRTSAAGLLDAAHALRDGRAVPRKGKGFVLLGAPSPAVGAKFVAQSLTWWKCNDVATITPVRPQTAPFVREVVARVESGPIGPEHYGPYCVPWEMSQEDEQASILSQIGLPEDLAEQVLASELTLPGVKGPSVALSQWFDWQRRVAGRTSFAAAEIRVQVERIHQRYRAYRRTANLGVRAMTIHQAKNREFESVIVLWPYQVYGSPARQRRLLYNAITRAKRQAVVIVQNSNRLNGPPFMPDG